MGKYMVRHKNPKPPPSDVALCGVRTRAKTLALLNNNKTPDNNNNNNNHSYLQLRSRRLDKPPRGAEENKNKKRRGRKRNYLNAPVDCEKKNICCDLGENGIENDVVVAEEEGCFGENFADCEARERSTRESTPISLVRDPEIIRTPGSSTRPTRSDQAHIRTHNPMLRHIPTAHDMDEFFAGAEVLQQQQFIEKYNFDPVNDMPLPGRYEWVKLEPKS